MDIKDYTLGDTLVRYVTDNAGHTTMLLAPVGKKDAIVDNWTHPETVWSPRADYIKQWRTGSLAHIHLHHHFASQGNGTSMKAAENYDRLKFRSQSHTEVNGAQVITTELASDEGYTVIHTVSEVADYRGIKVNTVFKNTSDRTFRVDLMTGFSLDNISPFAADDQPERLALHRFRGGWALEGRHITDSIEELGLEKAWQECFRPNEKFGSVGSYPTTRFFPIAAVEDKEEGVFWAGCVKHNGSWQMELSRLGDTLSFSGGYADCDFGSWYKNVAPGECLCSPECVVSVSDTDLEDAVSRITETFNVDCDLYGEKKPFAVQFNEFCTTWGKPTEEKMLGIANTLAGHGIDYLVMDAGWSVGGVGLWDVKRNLFPDISGMCEKIRSLGMVPGIWFESEVCEKKCPLFADKEHLLKKDGVPIYVADARSFYDMRDDWTREHLRKKVIGLLKDNGFGYIKNDYNANIGVGCDGDDSIGAGLNATLAKTVEFYREIKAEIPDIVIENCASGGHRLDAVSMGVTALSSFSDAHECKEIPYIAANLHSLMLPRQELIWAVLHPDDSDERLVYSLCATFFGRICISGEIDGLSQKQWDIVDEATKYYGKLSSVLMHGVTHIYGNRSESMRHPKGTQVAVRTGRDEALVIVHAFDEPADDITVELPEAYHAEAGFYADRAVLSGKTLTVKRMSPHTACSIYLKK